jgi:transposase
MAYTRAAVERVMKVQEAILQALSGRQSWLQVADVLGVSPRTVRRLRWRYERYGYDGVVDHRRSRPSPRAVPVAEVQRLLRLYRERYGGRATATRASTSGTSTRWRAGTIRCACRTVS